MQPIVVGGLREDLQESLVAVRQIVLRVGMLVLVQVVVRLSVGQPLCCEDRLLEQVKAASLEVVMAPARAVEHGRLLESEVVALHLEACEGSLVRTDELAGSQQVSGQF